MSSLALWSVIDVVLLIAGLALYLFIVGGQLTKVAGLLEEAAVRNAALLSFLIAASAGLILALQTSLWLILVGAIAILAAWGYTGFVCGISPGFPGLSHSEGQIAHVLLTRSPLIRSPKGTSPFDLHVLSTPPAFVLSQDQTLQKGLIWQKT